MEFTIIREHLLQPLTVVSSVIERRQTLPILSNIHLKVTGSSLTLTATDLELEMTAKGLVETSSGDLETTIPARKLLDICKAAPPGCTIKLEFNDAKVKLQTGRAKFALSSMDPREYPSIAISGEITRVEISNSALKKLLSLTHFAMAQQDVRYYLNGLFFDLSETDLTVVGTEGHRLAMATTQVAINGIARNLIVPRKAVMEMIRLLDDTETLTTLTFADDHFTFENNVVVFKSKVIDGNFPDYQRVIPTGVNNVVGCNRADLKEVLARVAILANEKYRAVRFKMGSGLLGVMANNQANEEAEEDLEVSYVGDDLEIGFNASYFLDVLSALTTEDVEIHFGDAGSSCLILEPGNKEVQYVIMPMRL